MNRPLARIALSHLLLIFSGSFALIGQADDGVNLELIMSDPQWFARSPESPSWGVDGESIFYSRKQKSSQLRDLWRVKAKDDSKQIVPTPSPSTAARFATTKDGKRRVFAWRGDLYIRAKKRIRRLTQTEAVEARPRFSLDEKSVLFTRDGDHYSRRLKDGLERQLVSILAKNDPRSQPSKASKGFLAEQELELFKHLQEQSREKKLREDREREWEQARRDQLIPKWYVGEDRVVRRSAVDRAARWAAATDAAKKEFDKASGRSDSMPVWINRDAYVKNRSVRSLVGTRTGVAEQVKVFHLKSRREFAFDFSDLPGVTDDPLAKVKKENARWRSARAAKRVSEQQGNKAKAKKPKGDGANNGDKKKAEGRKAEGEKPKPRPVFVGKMAFSDTGNYLGVECFSFDNKDRWLAVIDLRNEEEPQLRCLQHWRDEAWINRWRIDFDWLAGGDSLYFVGERSGFLHLSVQQASKSSARRLTRGRFEVTSVTPSRDGRRLFFRANKDHPGIHEVWSVDVGDGALRQCTELGGQNEFRLSPDETQLLVTHSSLVRPPELYLVSLDASESPQRLTRTITKRFRKIAWTKPQIVEAPNRHGDTVYGRLYLPEGSSAKPRAAVVFVHGAGYLQNAHYGWSGYFREFMFHTLLTRKGYVVLDLDYRASAGYGRDWRTAIYRRMGEPELEDLQDGVDWLVKRHAVDRDRVGVYGGSYGGFMTLMALFRAPDLFSCGAALRPVTDWSHYNHPYTSNILNTPQVDPKAYYRSSPIHFAAGLEDPLLMCHGMLDDNVFFKDTVRLTQRLIELKKENWETAIFPVEPHGFRTPSSWLDEYRRILKLFEAHLR